MTGASTTRLRDQPAMKTTHEEEMDMLRLVPIAIVMIAVLGTSFDASAARCKKGYYYDEETGMCIKRRGSG